MFEVVMFWFIAAHQEIWGKGTCDICGGSWNAFHVNGRIGFPSGKPNGTGLSTENFSKKREYLQRYSSFLVFTGITRKSLYHLNHRTSAMLLCKNAAASSFMSQCPTCGWMPLWVIAFLLQLSVNCH